ncbi:MAG: NAD(P)-dependent oxidoreductase [Rhizomicrobium sp.]
MLGMGIMGRQMAARIARAGFPTRVWNRTARDCEPAISAGATAASTIAEAVGDAAAIVIMVSTGDAVEDVLFAPNGVVAAAKPGCRVIVMSSIPPAAARDQAVRLANIGVVYLDAPVSGGEVGARNGSLSILVGGPEEEFASINPLLRAMGRPSHIGPVGSGQVAKLVNQTIVGITIAAVAEATLLARAVGADPDRILNALGGGFADSAVLRIHGPRMVAADFAPGAHAATQLKDLRTAQSLAIHAGLTLPTLHTVEALYAAMCANGLADLDHSGLYAWLERQVF